MKNSVKVLAIAAGLAISASAAQAAGGAKIGTLSCVIDGGMGFILGSSRHLDCTFDPSHGKNEHYTGSIDTIGIDIGVPNDAKMIWAVFAAGQTKAGALEGNYVGAAADASLGIGGGAKVLVGGFNRSLTLQPLSVQAQTGVNVALGVAGMKLQSH